jgi:hypothetical protein
MQRDMDSKLSIHKENENVYEVSDIGKKLVRTIELKEIAYTKLILSIHVKFSYSNITFNIVNRYKSKDHSDGNAVTSWEKLNINYETVSTTSMVKLDKQLRD